MDNRNEPTIKSAIKEDEALPDLKEMRSYKQIKLLLSDQLRIIIQGFATLGRKQAENECKELMLKLAEDRFTLAVLGQFKRGKSSLMNAIIGKPLLPTGVLPLTSAITILKYGATERLLVNRINSMLPLEQPVSTLADYVTENGNPGNQKKVKDVTIELPITFLRYGIEFVDTPGVGSAITANTETTYNFLPECDAVLFVTGADTPLTSTELEFLERIKGYVNKIFFVINKIDLVTKDEQNDIINFVSQTIKSQFKTEAVKAFPVSSKLALESRKNVNEMLYDRSGLKTLEATLVSFLSGEKFNTFLKAIIQKTLKIIDEEAKQNIFADEYIQQRIAALQQEKVKSVHGEPAFASSSVLNAKTKLEVLHENLQSKSLKDIEQVELNVPEQKNEEAKNLSPVKNTTAQAKVEESNNISEDLTIKTCAVCNHLVDTAFDFFAQWQYKLVTDEEAQNQFANELGFCPLHTWQLLSVSSPYGASVGYAKLAEMFAEKLSSFNNLNDGNSIQQLVHSSQTCPVCTMLQQEEKKYIEQLAEAINDNRQKYQQSDGACIWHLGMLIDVVKKDDTQQMLITHSIQHFKNDAEDMRSFALKQDALRRALQNANEKDAYRRTVMRIVGNRQVCMSWAMDREI